MSAAFRKPHPRVRIAGAFVLFAASLAGQTASHSTDVDRAIDSMRRSDFAAAIDAADQVLRQDPRDCRMLTIRGLALKGSGDAVKATQAFESAASHCPAYLPALEGLAEAQYAQRSPQAAVTLKRILVMEPDNETSHAMLAVVEARQGNCSEAVAHFERAGQLIDLNPAAERQYGVCLLAMDQLEKAKAVFQNLLAQEDSAENRLRYAYACWKAKDNSDGLDALSPLMAEATPDPEALALAARLEEASGDTPRAVATLQKAIASAPARAENYLFFAEISFNHSSPKVGVDMLNAGISQLPGDARLYVTRGTLEVQMNQFDSALADFRKAHQLDAHLSLAGVAIGIMLDQQHQTAASLAAYAAQVKAHPKDALVQYLYAEALSEENTAAHHEAALAAARRAVALEPGYQAALDLLCQLELQAGNMERALEVARDAVSRDPEDESAIYQEMMADRRLGKKDEVNRLVARLKEVKEHQRQTGMNYQLEEASR